MTIIFDKRIRHKPTKDAYETLLAICRKYKPKRVLEIGSGVVSTHAFGKGGVEELVSIDIEGSHGGGDEARELGMKRTFIKGDSVIEVAGVKGKFDMVLIDGDHSRAHIDAWNAIPKVRKGGHLVFHDVLHPDNTIAKYTAMLAVIDMANRSKEPCELWPFGIGYAVVCVDNCH